MPAEPYRVTYQLMLGKELVHSGEFEMHNLKKNEPIEVGRHPDCHISLAHMIEDAQDEQSAAAGTINEAMKHVNLVSRQHLLLAKPADRAGWILTSTGSNDLPQVSYSRTSGENASHPLAKDQQIADVDAAKPINLTFPAPTDAKKNLRLMFTIAAPTH